MRGDARAVTEQTSKLLWETCCRDVNPVAVRDALASDADVTQAVAAAGRHRIVPLLWRALGVAGARDVLGPIGEAALRDAADAFRMEALLLVPRAVALVVRPLTEAGLEPLIFKGPAVAARYPQPGLRPMDDIDLLLPPADHRHALAALEAAGWQVVRPAGIGHYDTVLIHDRVPRLSLEVHYALDHASERVTALDPAALWERRVPLECAGTPAFGLSPADELVVLAAHAGKPFHGFTRLMWIADLAMIVGDGAARGVPVDWDDVRDVALEARCLTVVGAALELARRAGVNAPSELFPLPSHGWRGQALRQLLSVTWPLTAHELPRYRLNYALTDAPARRLRNLLVLTGNWHGLRVRAFNTADRWRHPVRSRRQRGHDAGDLRVRARASKPAF